MTEKLFKIIDKGRRVWANTLVCDLQVSPAVQIAQVIRLLMQRQA